MAENLFCNVYHHCTYLVGQDARAAYQTNDILTYLKNVFQFDDIKCKTLIKRVERRSPPQMVLNVNIVEAENLAPMDPNGLNDPYCILWSSSAPKNHHITSAMMKTLNPVWQESFKIPIKSATEDILHFEVWDYDSVEFIIDKIAEIPNVKGIWGLNKLAKEIIQTIYLGKPNNEFVGSTQISLKNIPANGVMAWFKLRKNNKKLCDGKILLKLTFGSENAEQVDAQKEHQHLVKTLLHHHIRHKEFDEEKWDGVLSPESEIILKQHLVHCNLNCIDHLIARWTEFINVHQFKPLNFHIFANILNSLRKSLKDDFYTTKEDVALEALNLNEEDLLTRQFWNSMKTVLPSCYNYIRTFRDDVPNYEKICEQLDALLCIIHNLTCLNIPSHVDLFPRELYSWVSTPTDLNIESILQKAVIDGACQWLENSIAHSYSKNCSDEDKLLYLVKMTQLMLSDLEEAQTYRLDELFKERLDYSYLKTLFDVYQSRIVLMCESLVTDLCDRLTHLDFQKRNDKDANKDILSIGTLLFELFRTIQKIERIGETFFKDYITFETFPLRKFQTWFSHGVEHWLEITAYKVLQWIDNAIKIDNFAPVSLCSQVEYSNSAVDTIEFVFENVIEFWDDLAWADVEESYTFMEKIVEIICNSSIYYVDQVMSKVHGLANTCDTDETKFQAINMCCVIINNVDYICHDIYSCIEKKLGLDKIQKLSEKERMELEVENVVQSQRRKIPEFLEKLFKETMEQPITRFLQDIVKSPDQQWIKMDKFMYYMKSNLTTLNFELDAEYFNRVYDLIWKIILKSLFDLVKNGIEEKQPPFYFSNLIEIRKNIIEYFEIEEKINQEENKCLHDKLIESEKILNIYATKTPELIHQYYLERLLQQNQMEISECGEMTVCLHIDDNNLHVEILNAWNLNELGDPFVKFKRIPEHEFPAHELFKTKTRKKTSSPSFQEKFVIPLDEEHRQVKDALIMFVMEDEDIFTHNDYIAEAFVRLSDASDSAQSEHPKQIHLKLSRPKNHHSDILNALRNRSGDELAKKFVKREKSKIIVQH